LQKTVVSDHKIAAENKTIFPQGLIIATSSFYLLESANSFYRIDRKSCKFLLKLIKILVWFYWF